MQVLVSRFHTSDHSVHLDSFNPFLYLNIFNCEKTFLIKFHGELTIHGMFNCSLSLIRHPSLQHKKAHANSTVLRTNIFQIKRDNSLTIRQSYSILSPSTLENTKPYHSYNQDQRSSHYPQKNCVKIKAHSQDILLIYTDFHSNTT